MQIQRLTATYTFLENAGGYRVYMHMAAFETASLRSFVLGLNNTTAFLCFSVRKSLATAHQGLRNTRYSK